MGNTGCCNGVNLHNCVDNNFQVGPYISKEDQQQTSSQRYLMGESSSVHPQGSSTTFEQPFESSAHFITPAVSNLHAGSHPYNLAKPSKGYQGGPLANPRGDFDFSFPHSSLAVIPTMRALLVAYPLKPHLSAEGVELISEEIDKGETVYRYFGESKDGVAKHGRGQYYVLPDNTFYSGHFSNNLPEGFFQIYYGSGDYFEGTMSQGELSKGRLVSKSGEIYEGEFRQGKRHGQGAIYYLDGSYKMGKFHNGKPVGTLIEVDSSGQRKTVEASIQRSNPEFQSSIVYH